MSDELTITPEPIGTPAAVSTGYTRQNTKISEIQNGLDCSAPYGTDTDEVTLPVGGPVDINGVLASITSAATLSGIAADTDYYIYLAAGSDASHYTPTLTTSPGTFDASKNARYTASGERILNWKLRGDGVGNVVCTRITDPQKTDVQPLGKADSPTFEDVTVTDDLTVGDDLSVDGDLTVGGYFRPRPDHKAMKNSVAASSSVSIARGVYQVYLDHSDLSIEMYDNTTSTWKTIMQGPAGGVIFADGTYVHLKNAGASVHYIYRQLF